MLSVRRFAPGDARAVRTLDRAAVSGAGARGRGDDDVVSVAAAYMEDGGEFLVGICDGRVVAMGALRHVTDAVAELDRMPWTRGFQRRGFGRAMLARLEARAWELGYGSLRLDTTAMLAAVQRFYGSDGYRVIGRGWLAGVEVVDLEKTL